MNFATKKPRSFRNRRGEQGIHLAFAAAAFLGLGIGEAQAQSLTSGNLVIERVGSGTGILTNGSTAVFVDQFSTTGTSVNTISLPNAASRPSGTPFNLTASGTATSEGLLTRSANGLSLVLGGYNGISTDASIASSSTATLQRTIGVISGDGTVTTSKSFTVQSGQNSRGAVTLDGTKFYLTGGNGIDYLGSSNSGSGTSLTTRTTRQGNIFNNTLFVTSGSNGAPYGAGGVFQVGSAGTLPTAASPTFTKIIDNGGGSALSFAFQFNTGMTVAYLTNDTSSTGGIEKWTSNGSGTWTKTGTLSLGTTTNAGARGLTVDWSNPNAPILYATTTVSEGGGAGGNKLVKITDDGTTFSSLSVATLATAGTNQIFRGVDQALLPAVWTSNSAGNWASTATTTYNSTIGVVTTASKDWNTTLVDGTNLAFQKVNAASLILTNNTSLTNVSSINFNGGGTISGGQNTAYTLTGSALTLSGSAATSALGTFTANSTTYTKVIENNSGVAQTVSIPLTLGATNQAFRATTGALNINGTVNNNGNTLTVGGASNTTFGSSAVISGSGGFTKVEAGTATLSAANTYTGGTTLSGGTAVAANNGAFGSTGAQTVTFNGGKLASDNDTRALANNIVVNNVAGNQISGPNSITLNGTASGPGTLQIAMTNTSKSVTVNPSTTDGFAPGMLRITSGTLLLGASDRIGKSTQVDFNGGTFGANNFSEGSAGSAGLGTMILSASSVLDYGTLGGGANILAFGGVGSHSASSTFQITNYDNGLDHLYFTGLASDFTSVITGYAQNEVSFNGVSGYAAISYVGYFEIVAVPEPTTVLGALGLLVFLTYRERTRVLRFCNGAFSRR